MATGENVVQTLFLDFDGTIVDSQSSLYQIYQDVLRSFGYSGSREEFLSLVGATIKEICIYLSTTYALSFGECKNRYEQKLLSFYKNRVKPFPGVAQALETFRGLSIKLFVVTSCSQKYVDAFFASQYDLSLYIDGVHTPQGNVRGKPDPQLYEQALQRFSCDPQSTWVVEDSENGILAAKRALLPVIPFVEGEGWAEVETKVLRLCSR